MQSTIWAGSTRVDEQIYAQVCQLLEPFTTYPEPWKHDLDAPGGLERAAIYVAVNQAGRACYVGQVRRPLRDGVVAARIREHLRSPSKRAQWSGYWMVPLMDTISTQSLNACEWAVATMVGVSLRNHSWKSAEALIV